jgi:DNA-binding CsgD family transcriptional regulator
MKTRISDHVTCESLDDSGIFLYKTTSSSFRELRLWQEHVRDQMRKWNLTTPLLLLYDLTHRGVSIPYAVLNNYNFFNVGVTPDGRKETDRLLRANQSLHVRLAIVVPDSISGEISKRLASESETRGHVSYRIFISLDAATGWLLAEKEKTSTGIPETEMVEQLTRREIDVLKLIVEGYSNKDVANTLTIHVGTVKWHLQRIYRKLDVQTRTQAIVKAHKYGF